MFYARRPDVKIRHVEGETLVLDDENGQIHQLNYTASLIWDQCDGKTAIPDIVRRLAREFGLEDSVAAKDVAEVIKKLRDLNLISK